MKFYAIKPCTVVYLLLLALTLLTWGMGKYGLYGLPISLLILLFALVKALLIGDYFMGLKGLQGLWRWPVIIWLAIPGSLITLAFVISV